MYMSLGAYMYIFLCVYSTGGIMSHRIDAFTALWDLTRQYSSTVDVLIYTSVSVGYQSSFSTSMIFLLGLVLFMSYFKALCLPQSHTILFARSFGILTLIYIFSQQIQNVFFRCSYRSKSMFPT